MYNLSPQIIQTAIESGVTHFAVNGVSEYDWILVKKMSEDYPSSVIPCFGLHPWFITNRTSNWYNTLRDFFNSTPSATVGEIGLDKSPLAQQFDFNDQIPTIFTRQLALSKELKKPVSVHCLLAFDELIEIMQYIYRALPCRVILHSYAGSAELVPTLTKLGAYFSFSGHNMNSEPQNTEIG
ncbi:hypothetical protein MKX03_030549 [Papaver bracteatum]|nr:hypothetical protein MKX03_030549 [Papaver bracteatum]